jgi:hypothetical protein
VLKKSKIRLNARDENEEIFIDSYCLRYAPGVSWAEGEDWYLGHHTREGKQLPGMKHYKTWRTIHVQEPSDSPLKPNKSWFKPIKYQI